MGVLRRESDWCLPMLPIVLIRGDNDTEIQQCLGEQKFSADLSAFYLIHWWHLLVRRR